MREVKVIMITVIFLLSSFEELITQCTFNLCNKPMWLMHQRKKGFIKIFIIPTKIMIREITLLKCAKWDGRCTYNILLNLNTWVHNIVLWDVGRFYLLHWSERPLEKRGPRSPCPSISGANKNWVLMLLNCGTFHKLLNFSLYSLSTLSLANIYFAIAMCLALYWSS